MLRSRRTDDPPSLYPTSPLPLTKHTITVENQTSRGLGGVSLRLVVGGVRRLFSLEPGQTGCQRDILTRISRVPKAPLSSPTSTTNHSMPSYQHLSASTRRSWSMRRSREDWNASSSERVLADGRGTTRRPRHRRTALLAANDRSGRTLPARCSGASAWDRRSYRANRQRWSAAADRRESRAPALAEVQRQPRCSHYKDCRPLGGTGQAPRRQPQGQASLTAP